MITNKRYQTLLMLATTGKPLKKDATEEEQDAIPFDEKKWGIITNLKITPLPINKEEN